MSEPEYLSSRLLLAMPGMGDPRFERSVIAMCLHDENGAFGIGVGHVRGDVRLHSLLRDLDIDPGLAPDCQVHHGGPVEPGRGFVLHSNEWTSEGTLTVEPLCALSASIEILRNIAEGKGPRHWLIALGYAGWAAGQLEGEMRRHCWYAAAPHPEILFDRPVEDRWTETWKAEGIDPAVLANVTGRA